VVTNDIDDVPVTQSMRKTVKSTLASKRGVSEVFNDLVSMGVCSYHSTNIHGKLREKSY
jgi:hypothetical protein